MSKELIERLHDVREEYGMMYDDYDYMTQAATLLERQSEMLEKAREALKEVRAAASLASAFDEENRDGPWAMLEARVRMALKAMEQ